MLYRMNVDSIKAHNQELQSCQGRVFMTVVEANNLGGRGKLPNNYSESRFSCFFGVLRPCFLIKQLYVACSFFLKPSLGFLATLILIPLTLLL